MSRTGEMKEMVCRCISRRSCSKMWGILDSNVWYVCGRPPCAQLTTQHYFAVHDENFHAVCADSQHSLTSSWSSNKRLDPWIGAALSDGPGEDASSSALLTTNSAECVRILCDHYKIPQAGQQVPSHFQPFLLNFPRLHSLVLRFFLR